MIILKQKGSWMTGISEKAAKYAPDLAQHRDEMSWYHKLNAVDKETGRAALFGRPFSNSRAISSIPVAVASQLMELYPEIFRDTTGKSMLKFLSTEEGQAYRL